MDNEKFYSLSDYVTFIRVEKERYFMTNYGYTKILEMEYSLKLLERI